MVKIVFENYLTGKSLTLGPFDWIEEDRDVIIAEAEDGEIRHDELAVRRGPFWETEGSQSWTRFIVSAA